MTKGGLTVVPPPGGFQRRELVEAIRGSGLVARVRELSGGPFGHSPEGISTLEGLLTAADLSIGAARELAGLIRSELGTSDFSVPQLTAEQQRLVAGFQIAVLSESTEDDLERIGGRVAVEGELERDGLDSLLGGDDPLARVARILTLSERYLALRGRDGANPNSAAGAPQIDPTRAARTIVAFMVLLRRAVVGYLRASSLKPLLDALEKRPISIAGQRYRGMARQAASANPSGLLPIRAEQIVGNTEYVQAGLRLARDVAGYDFASRQNPKRINPVLFGLGRPGCGKTVTAHAIGNFFLEYCAQRGVPAMFRVVQRADWASSYQNASASNLIRIFRDEVYAFDGVCGVYWPDIDTAFASRSASDLRIEEKQNLGAVFGIFDGTLLPKDGKWFLICDANTMHMDEATISRIAQNLFTVAGPTTSADYVKLMREIMLRDVIAQLPADDAAWTEIGSFAAEHELSGRAIEAICGNIRVKVQDFELPEAYFRADSDERRRIMSSLYNSVDAPTILGELRRYVEFQSEAEERDQRARFDQEVEQLVRQLNASKAAAERAIRGEGS